MLDFPPVVQKLITAFRQLPSVGAKTAERFALHLLKHDPVQARSLASALEDCAKDIRPCSRCGFFAEKNVCQICDASNRQQDLLCVVESPADVIAFERSGSFPGLYHVLHGLLSPLDGIGPEELKIDSLIARIRDLHIREVVLGLSSDVKGETTAFYIANELKALEVNVTRLATGIAVGAGLEFVDSVTLGHALQQRKPL